MKHTFALPMALAITALLAAALACGSGDGATSSSAPRFTSDFIPVCEGEGIENAPYYGSAANGEGPFPVLVFRRSGEGEPWQIIPTDSMGEGFP